MHYQGTAEKFISAMEVAERHHGARGVPSALEFWGPDDPRLIIWQSWISSSGKERASLFGSAKGYITQNVCKQNICVHKQQYSKTTATKMIN